eukprot:6206354-Pleurochrysis_carterae.AAC.3
MPRKARKPQEFTNEASALETSTMLFDLKCCPYQSPQTRRESMQVRSFVARSHASRRVVGAITRRSSGSRGHSSPWQRR